MVDKSIQNNKLVVRALFCMVTAGNGRGWLRPSLAASFLVAALTEKERYMLKENQKLIIGLIVVLLVIGAGYWHGARPYLAAKECHKVALDNSGYQKDNWQAWAGNQKTQTNYMFVYELCLHKEGLNP